MRMPNAAKLFRHKGGSDHPQDPSLFDSGIGDWLLDFTAIALIALVVGTVIRWAYIAVFYK